MRIVIWGTGGASRNYMQWVHQRLPGGMDVIAFTDSYVDEEGAFFGIPLIKSTKLKMLDADVITIMPEAWEHKIKSKIIRNKLGDNSVIWSRADFYSAICKGWKLSDKKACFAGDINTFERAEFRAKKIFSETIYVKDYISITDKYDLYFICPPVYKARKDSEDYSRMIFDYLRSTGIEDNRIWDYNAWKSWIIAPNKYCFGNNNPEKKYYIIATNEPLTGWGNILQQVMSQISYAEANDMIPVVDMKNARNQYLDPELIGEHDAWLDFFMPVNNTDLDDVYRSKDVEIGSGNIIRGITMNPFDIELREDIRREVLIWRDVHFSKKKMLGVIYRGTDYNNAYGHTKPIEIERYMDVVEHVLQVIDYEHIFLATEVEEAVIAFGDKFGDKVCFFEQARFAATERRWLATIEFDRKDDRRIRGGEYLKVIYLLAECDSIFSSRNAAKDIALILNNGKYEHVIDLNDILLKEKDM